MTLTEHPGAYVYVVNILGVIHVAPDGPHMHPHVLGGAEPALYAGDLTISRPGNIAEVTNLSGTFAFRSRRSLCHVASLMRGMGFLVRRIVWYPPDGSTPPRHLNC